MVTTKKFLCGVLAATLTVAFAGCAGGQKGESGSGEELKTVSIFASRGASLGEEMKDYNDVTSFKEMESLTGVHINWNLPPSEGFDEKFKLMIASNDLTDVIVADWKTEGAEKYKKDGVIISLSDMKDCMPNFISYLEAHPEFAKDCVTPEGEILYLPYIREDLQLNIFRGPLIRQDWLDKLNLEVPATAEELYQVLKAFKEQDPNGNDQADELPMSGYGSETVTRLLSMFNTGRGFYLDGDTVKYSVMEPEFEEGIGYIAKLFSEELIDPDYVFQERSKCDGKMTNNRVGFMYSYQPTAISNTMAEKDPTFKLVGIPNLKNKDGKRTTDLVDYIQSVLGSRGAAISTKCKNPKAVLKWLDSFFSPEGIEIMNFGKEGETYTMNGEKHIFTDQILHNSEFSVSRAFGRNIGVFNSYFPTVQKWESYSQSLSEYGRNAIEIWSDVETDNLLPDLTFTESEKSTVTQKMTQITTYVDELIDKLILNQSSVDTLASAREQVKALGIEEVLAIYQTAYDRYRSVETSF